MVVWWIIIVKRTSGYTSKVFATGTFHLHVTNKELKGARSHNFRQFQH